MKILAIEENFWNSLEKEIFKGNLHESLLKLENYIKTVEDDDSTLKFLLFQGFIYYLQGNIELASRRITALLKKPHLEKNFEVHFLAWIYYSFITPLVGNEELIEKSATMALELAKISNNEKFLSAAFNATAWNLYFRSYFTSALEYTKYNLDIKKDVFVDILTKECTALCEFQIGKIESALNILLDLKLEIEFDFGYKIWLSRILAEIGTAYSIVGNLDESEKFYKKSITLSMEMGTLQVLSEVYINLGILEGKRGNFNAALDLIQSGYDTYNKFTPIGPFLGYYYASLAEIYLKIGDFTNSKLYYSLALEKLEKFSSTKEYGLTLIGMSKVEALNGFFESAEEYLRQAKEFFRLREDMLGLEQVYATIGYISHLRGEFDESIIAYEMYKSLALNFEIKVDFIPTMSNYIFLLIDIGETEKIELTLSLLQTEVEKLILFSEFDYGIFKLIVGACDLDNDDLTYAEKSLKMAESILSSFGPSTYLVKCIILLSELYFKKFLIHKSPIFINLSIQHINRVLELAKKNNQQMILSETLLIRSEIHTLQYEFDEALCIINESIIIATSLGLDAIINRAKIQRNTIQAVFNFVKSIEIQTQSNLFSESTSKNILETFRTVIGRLQSFDSIKNEDLFITVFKISEQGVDVIISDNLPILVIKDYEMDLKHSLINMGTFLLTSLGQGDKYNEGLFGPLPFFAHPDYQLLVFAKIVSDKLQNDARLTNKNYSLTVFTFPKGYIYPNRILFEKTMEDYFFKNPDVNDLNQSMILQIKLNVTK